MKRCHLLRVAAPPHTFAQLGEAFAELGERLGWLDWRPEEAMPALESSPLADLATAAALPALRSVVVAAGGSVVIKSNRGQPVLKDVLREHFRGCLAVLVRSEEKLLDVAAADRDGAQLEVPQLEASAHGFVVRRADKTWQLEAAALVKRLRAPRPFAVEQLVERDEPGKA